MGDEGIHTLFMTGLPNDVMGASLPTACAVSLARFPTHVEGCSTPPGSSVPSHEGFVLFA